MGPTKRQPNNLKEIKARKEQRKKWKEENLLKKMKKQEKLQTSNESTKVIEIKDIPTISIAVAGTIFENSQSKDLQVRLVGQIARSACIFDVDEVIIFDDYGDDVNAKKTIYADHTGQRAFRDSCVQFGKILKYLENPKHIRKYTFEMDYHLKQAELFNPLKTLLDSREDIGTLYREGVTLNKPVKAGRGSLVNVGLPQDVQVDKRLKPNVRCTVRLLPQEEGSKKLKGILVSPTEPRQETGTYWGYEVRFATSLSEVLNKCPYKSGYDLNIGTSDKGTSIDDFTTTSCKHALIVFGGLNGLEYALENDDDLNVDDVSSLFNHYLNVLPNQGTRTIRTEEAIRIALAALTPKIKLI